jgi:hypothetical protein
MRVLSNVSCMLAMCYFHVAGLQMLNADYKSFVASPLMICNLSTTRVEKPLPTFQLHGSIITTSFHIAELGGNVSVYSLYVFYI